jgi:hypothetical protein
VDALTEDRHYRLRASVTFAGLFFPPSTLSPRPRLATDLPDQLRQIHFQRRSECVNDDDRRVPDATLQMIDHRTADAGESRQLALRNPRFLASFLERSNDCTGKLL